MNIVQATGQTCNQFWIYSNFLADSIEKNEKFAIWVPDKIFVYFPGLLNSENIIYPLYKKKYLLFFKKSFQKDEKNLITKISITFQDFHHFLIFIDILIF